MNIGNTHNYRYGELESSTGIESFKEYSDVRAQAEGRGKRSFDLIPPSAEDFGGLLYKMLSKGKVGDAQWEWMQDNFSRPMLTLVWNEEGTEPVQIIVVVGREDEEKIKGTGTNMSEVRQEIEKQKV